MVVAIFEIEVKEGCMDEMESFLRGTLHDTRGWPGCYELSSFADLENPNKIMFVGKWASKETHQEYLEWRADPGPGTMSLDEVAPLLASEPIARYLAPAGF